MSSSFKALIFDLGGVLVAWDNSITYRYIEENYGIDFNTSKIELEKRLPLVQMGILDERDWIEDFLTSHCVPKNSEVYNVWGKTFENFQVNGEVLRIVQRLKRLGFKIAVLSNTEPSRAALLKQNDFIRNFDLTVFSCEVGLRKASSLKYSGPVKGDIYKLTINKMGFDAGEYLLIDDTVECIEDASKSGISGLLFTNVINLINDFGKIGISLGSFTHR